MEVHFSLKENDIECFKKTVKNSSVIYNTNEEIKRILQDIVSEERVNFDTIKKFYEFYASNNDDAIYFHEFITKFEIALPKPQILPRSPELIERINKLERERDEKEYQRMVRNVKLGETKSEIAELRSEVKALRGQLISVFNFVVSVIGTFTFFYKAIEYSSTSPKLEMQILGGIFASTVVGLAELYFIAVYDLS